MYIDFSRISFKQNFSSNKSSDQKPSVSKPIYTEFDDRRTKYGVVAPTSYDDCYEKMSFEKYDDKVDFFRDSENELDTHNRNFDYDVDQDMSIEDLQYRYQNYSYDDIPLSESLIRPENGFYETPCIEIDTDMNKYSALILDFVNYKNNIIPRILNGNTKNVWGFAREATSLKSAGYNSSAIDNALINCTLKNKGEKCPNIRLFSFLAKHPYMRRDVVFKDSEGNEIFDKDFANNFEIFHNNYFYSEEDIKNILNLCKIEKSGVNLLSNELCEIVGLMRLKTAQGVPYVPETLGDDNDEQRNKLEKFVKKDTPLTKKDLELLSKLKPNGKLDVTLYDIVKTLLGQKKETVSYVLENIDKLAARKNGIEKVKSDLIDKYADSDITTKTKNLDEVINLDKRSSAIAGRLFSTRGFDFDPVSAGDIISIIHANSNDKQRLLDTVEVLLDNGCSNKKILDAIAEFH